MSENLPAFLAYLDEAPLIADATNHESCARARNYFGFEDFYINDDGICGDIEQLKLSKNFDFLEEFFNQGSGGSDSDGDGCPDPAPPATVEPFVLEEIDESKSSCIFALHGIAYHLKSRGSNPSFFVSITCHRWFQC